MSTTFSDKSWNSSEDFEDDNSSTTTSSAHRRISGDLDLPGGVITTHCVSSVIRPGRRRSQDPLQFVKIQTAELSKKAVEQIRLAEEVKITKEKIKEVEEEWQSNLLNWKSKRRQSRGSHPNESPEEADPSQPRKIKTFQEILNEKAKSGHRIGYNLHKYIDSDDLEEAELAATQGLREKRERHEKKRNEVTIERRSLEEEIRREGDPHQEQLMKDLVFVDTSLLKEFSCNLREAREEIKEAEESQEARERIYKQTVTRSENQVRDRVETVSVVSEALVKGRADERKQSLKKEEEEEVSKEKPGQRLKQSLNTANEQQKNVWNYLLQHQQQEHPERIQCDSQAISDEEEDHHNESLDNEEAQQLQQQQLLSFKAKLSAFESLAKPEPEPVPVTELPPKPKPKLKQKPIRDVSLKTTTGNNSVYQDKSEHSQGSVPSKPRPPAAKDLIQREHEVKQSLIQQQTQLQQQPIYGNQMPLEYSRRPGYYSEYDLRDIEDVTERVERNLTTSCEQLYPSQSQPYSESRPQLEVSPNKKEYRNNGQKQQEQAYYDHHQLYQQQKQQQQQQLQYYKSQDIVYENQAPRQYEQQQYYLLEEEFKGKGHQFTPESEPHYSNNQNSPLHQQEQQLQQQKMYPMQLQQQHMMLQKQQQQQQLKLQQQQQQQLQQQADQQKAPPKPPLKGNYSSPENESQAQARNQQQLNHYLYYPKPYHSNKQPPQKPKHTATSPYKPVPNPRPVSSVHGNNPQHQQQPLPQYHQLHPHPQHQHQHQHLHQNHVDPKGSQSDLQLAPLPASSGYNRNHWVIQEAELRRQIAATSHVHPHKPLATPRVSKPSPPSHPPSQPPSSLPSSSLPPVPSPVAVTTEHLYENFSQAQASQQQLQQQKQMLSVSGRKKCSSCGEELGRGCAAMVIESLSLYYHINCFRCSVCHIQLGNGTCGTDVRVRNHKLHCQNCYSNDEAGLKFSRV